MVLPVMLLILNLWHQMARFDYVYEYYVFCSMFSILVVDIIRVLCGMLVVVYYFYSCYIIYLRRDIPVTSYSNFFLMIYSLAFSSILYVRVTCIGYGLGERKTKF